MILTATLMVFFGLYLIWLIYLINCDIRRYEPQPKIDRNVTWLRRMVRKSPCEIVYQGDMLSTLKGHPERPVDVLIHLPISLN